MKKSIALMIITALSVSMLGACGTTKDSDTNNVQKSTQTQAQDASSEKSESDAKNISYPYTYTDAAGRAVELKEQPTRVAVDYLPLWETLAMLDVMPVAASGATNYKATWDAFKGYDLSGVEELGESDVNLEKLAEVKPDIILSQARDLNNLDIGNLEKVAPVAVFGNDTKMDWRKSLRDVAKIVNKEEKAEEVISDLDTKITEAREKIKTKYDGQTVMQISLMGQDKYYITYRSDLYDKTTGLGLNVPAGYTTSTSFEQISLESIVSMNPDYIFLNVFDGDDAIYQNLADNAVFKSLKAVQNNHVYTLDGGGHAMSPLATLYTINFITDTLIEQ